MRQPALGFAPYCRVMWHEIRVHAPQPLLQGRLRAPAQCIDGRNIEKLARRAVRPRRVELDFAAKADDPGNHPGKIGDRNVFAGPDIEELQIGIALHDKYTGVGKIVDGKEFTARRAGAPYRDVLVAVDLGLVKTPN